MFDFFKSKLGKSATGSPGFDVPEHSAVRCTDDGGIIAVNLDQTGWHVDSGRMGMNQMLLPPAGGGRNEIFREEELEENVLKFFQRVKTGRGLGNAFQYALENQSFLISFLPSGNEVRFRNFEIFEKFLNDKFQRTARDFESIKLYGAIGRPGMNRCVRKLQGKGLPQVIFNLTEETFRYFHYWKGQKDITIDSFFDDGWQLEPEQIVTKVETAIRSMDMEYFERLRTGLANGMLFLVLPSDANLRTVVLGTAERLLDAAPGGAIDLSSPRVIRLYRRRGSQLR